MPSRFRINCREERKKTVLLAFERAKDSMTAATVAASLQCPVQDVVPSITALVDEGRLIESGTILAKYRRAGSTKEVAVYALPPSIDAAVLPRWMLCPPPMRKGMPA